MLRKTNYSAIIGPQCSQVCSFVGRLAAYYNIACFSGVCQDTEMLDKTVFTVREYQSNQHQASLFHRSPMRQCHSTCMFISQYSQKKGIRFDNNVMAAIFFGLISYLDRILRIHLLKKIRSFIGQICLISMKQQVNI